MFVLEVKCLVILGLFRELEFVSVKNEFLRQKVDLLRQFPQLPFLFLDDIKMSHLRFRRRNLQIRAVLDVVFVSLVALCFILLLHPHKLRAPLFFRLQLTFHLVDKFRLRLGIHFDLFHEFLLFFDMIL